MEFVAVTGDIHGEISRIEIFAGYNSTTLKDILIVLGDAGINFYGKERDKYKKEKLKEQDLTIFCIHGNHEMRPQNIDTYVTKEWHGGVVYYEEEYPNILFAKDGEIYNINGKSVLVIGGAYSIDKYYRLRMGYPWWEDEQPSDEIKNYVENQLDKVGWKVDIVLSHTCPLKYEPVEWFMAGIDQSMVDKSTEKWLDNIENHLEYNKWYCGHFHGEKVIDKVKFMIESIEIMD